MSLFEQCSILGDRYRRASNMAYGSDICDATEFYSCSFCRPDDGDKYNYSQFHDRGADWSTATPFCYFNSEELTVGLR